MVLSCLSCANKKEPTGPSELLDFCTSHTDGLRIVCNIPLFELSKSR